MSKPVLMSIVELGGYPDFVPLYVASGYEVVRTDSLRKAVKLIRKHRPEVIVAEFNYQSDFRDRSSNLESLMARLQRHPDTRVIVFYQREHTDKFDRFRSRFSIFDSIALPVDPDVLEDSLRRAMAG